MKTFNFEVISLAPAPFRLLYELGVIGRALSSGIAGLNIYNPRDFTLDKYKKVDDQPYGGGFGMVLKPEPFFAAFESIPCRPKKKVVLMSPQGRRLEQSDLQDWADNLDQLILICGHYEGFDERIRTLADEEVSIGDFVLTGGELPAMLIINGVLRLLPGVIGSRESLINESHNLDLLEYPHYTRPAEFRGMRVPEVLRSGDHAVISEWRNREQQIRTKQRRPDMYSRWVANQSLAKLTIDENIQELVNIRVGNGYDIHRLVPDRALILGGVLLEHPEGLGLDGHSDADVLAHAITDALLGAAALGDIGKYFPPDNPQWEGADSLKLLESVVALINEKGWRIINVDSVVVAERPKLKSHIDLMRKNLAAKMNIDISAVGVKATTNETLGPEGLEEGISCHAIALLQK